MRHGDVSYFDKASNPTLSAAEVSLNAEGRLQAQAAARLLSDVDIDHVVTSTLPRTIQTAQIVLGDRTLQIEKQSALREIEAGSMRGVTPSEAQDEFAHAFTRPLTRESCFLRGETFGSLFERVLPCFEQLLSQKHWKNLLLVAHGGVNRVILSHALRSGLDSFAALEQDQACINIIDVDDNGRMIVRLANFTPYNTNKKGLTLTTMESLFEQYLKLLRA